MSATTQDQQTSKVTPSFGTLAESKKWQRLLHYKKMWWGGYESQADGLGFFLHPEGKHRPLEELMRSIELFAQKDHPTDEDAACRFPARLKWLNRELGFPWKVDLSGCTRYVQFFSKVAARRASLVFSSYHLSNPNSAFGHTFLRLSRYENQAETVMLDYAINYAAQAEASNPFSYAIKGLFGGFRGFFSALPYYYKLREYGDYEFRDLWSYDLKLSFPQILELVDHVWELGHTEFDYFYFLENCSYHLLSLLEVVAPEKNLTDQYQVFAVPTDTVRLLQVEGLLAPGSRRDSLYSQLLLASSQLKSADLAVAAEVVERPSRTDELVALVSHEKAARILDVAILAYDYRHAEKVLMDDPVTHAQKSFILKARAMNPIISEELKRQGPSVFDSPAQSHPPSRAAFSVSHYSKHGLGQQMELRAALHDLLDPPQGAVRNAGLEIGRVRLNYQEKNFSQPRLLLDELSVLSLRNFPAQSYWASPVSWEIEWKVAQLNRESCFDCPSMSLSGSVGNSIQLWQERVILGLLLNSEVNVHNYFQDGYRLALGPKILKRVIWSDKLISEVSTFYHLNTYRVSEFSADQEFHAEAQLRYHGWKKLSLFTTVKTVNRDKFSFSEGRVGFQYFY